MRKKLFIAILLLLLFPVTVYCTVYSGTCGRPVAYPKVDSTNLMWQINTSTRVLTITGSGKMRDYDMDTPAPWHQYRDDFDVVWLSDAATCIGEYAFWDLTADSIHIGAAVESVHRYAFQGSSFQSFVFPSATRIIELEGASYCQRLKRVIFGGGVESIGYFAFYSCDSLQLVDMGASDAVLGVYSFAYCGQLTTFVCTQIRHID
ncbi:MAG: leucine-rich repeat domain-containing protein, partial [Bacteroidales bacterium]|nr:leucine-rich repeat domain-containing protein [Bacteroidales bacterium]